MIYIRAGTPLKGPLMDQILTLCGVTEGLCGDLEMEAHRDTIMTWIGNGVSLGAIVTSFMGLVPALAALVALLWYLVQIYESKTVQVWIAKRRLRQLARLKAAVMMLETKTAQLPPEISRQTTDDPPV